MEHLQPITLTVHGSRGEPDPLAEALDAAWRKAWGDWLDRVFGLPAHLCGNPDGATYAGREVPLRQWEPEADKPVTVEGRPWSP